MAEATPKISIRGLRKSFGRKVVLDGIDLDIRAGESLVIIGGSGSGKTVLIKNVIGLVSPDDGSIKIDGEETVGMNARDRARIMKKFGMLFQGGALFDSLPVWENVAFGLVTEQGVRRTDAKARAAEVLAAVGLAPEVAELWPAELSGGMQKRVSLARAIATEPEIILFDEPTTGLDPIMGDVINDLIIACVRKLGATALTITHDMQSARKIATRIAMIHRGRIIWHGPVAEVDRSGNPFVEQFIYGSAEGPIQMEVRRL
ncbi:MAG: ATP-binding cassette domain-containing protein [Alphaproteobacteria bacterium]|nr:ATP-binding cassette domain-containing protein [Alphaproteobacteria bacterium]